MNEKFSVNDRFGILEARLKEVVVQLQVLRVETIGLRKEVVVLKSTQGGLREEVKLLNEALESRGIGVYGRS